MDWTILKNTIYEFDGSSLEIHVLDASMEDWRKWVELVNDKYDLEFYNGQNQEVERQINFNILLDRWTGKTDLVNSAMIKLDHIEIHCNFIEDKVIESGIDPRDIRTIEDHLKLMDYMRSVSLALDKRVILTPETLRDHVLIACEGEEIEITPG